jgi:hypothetical protein
LCKSTNAYIILYYYSTTWRSIVHLLSFVIKGISSLKMVLHE